VLVGNKDDNTKCIRSISFYIAVQPKKDFLICHPERSEGSKILRFALNDNVDILKLNGYIE